MATILVQNIDQSKVINNFDSMQYTVPSAGMYSVSCSLNKLDGPSLQMQVRQNGSVQVTSSSVPPQTEMTIEALLNCAANDTITLSFVVNSADVNNNINSAKGILSIRAGTV